MRRKLMDKLVDWKNNSCELPMLLAGGNGVGKTYLAYDFGKSFYEQFIYIDLAKEQNIYSYVNPCNPTQFEEYLVSRYSISNEHKKVLIILDNIIWKEDKLQNLIYLFSLLYSYNLLIISNDLIDINECKESSFIFNIIKKDSNKYILPYKSLSPGNTVNNRVSTLEDESIILNMYMEILYPLDFEEYLLATGKEWYIDTIRLHFSTNQKIPDIVHNELLFLFEIYLNTGGMPLTINEYITTESIHNITRLHELYTRSYLFEANTVKSEQDMLKIHQVFISMNKQLLKDNHKFQFSLIRKGATQLMYDNALDYLQSTFYGLGCRKVSDDSLQSVSAFTEEIEKISGSNVGIKLYFMDVGILNTTISTMEKSNTYEIKNIRKALFENSVAQCLRTNGYDLCYWESSSQAKMDFIIAKDKEIIPIEVKIDHKTRSKNFSVLKNKHNNIQEQIKISTKNFAYNNHVKYVPIYSVFCI